LPKKLSLDKWTCANSAELYGVNNWGKPYFHISDKGELCVNLKGEKGHVTTSLMDITAGLKDRGIDFPVLLRFADILDSRLKILNESFRKAISEMKYKGQYRGVFPIKVNQQEQVIKEITQFGQTYHHGLEAGSKAELIAAISYLKDPEAYLVCNGYKDEEFIDLALYSTKMGMQTVLVVEMPGEVELIIKRAKALGVKPIIGIRVKLSTKASGHWNSSGGDQSMFGLNPSQIIDVVDSLRQNNMLDCLQMLHYHLGSQIPNIRDIRQGITEACRFYTSLVKEGAPMNLLDIGGGLAIDYDGSKTNFGSSRNYSLDEYCLDIVEVIMTSCDNAGVEHPTIISESGRATVTHYSILMFNILDVGCLNAHEVPQEITEDTHEFIQNLHFVYRNLTEKNAQECFNDAIYYRQEIQSRFLHSEIGLRERALSEKIFWGILYNIAKKIKNYKYIPDEMQGLEDMLADIYYGNFSMFQSLPDLWAIDQLFPVLPIHRLNEKPEKKGIIADITCDSDGKISRFIDLHEVKKSLPLHDLKKDEDYILGVFLVGAYQETLGDLHNLMGDTNVVSIRLTKQDEIEFRSEIEGDSVADVLSYVEYDPKKMVENVRRKAESAVHAKKITPQDRRVIMRAYEDGMRGYTYYEK
jgi:arginine decarboxylase